MDKKSFFVVATLLWLSPYLFCQQGFVRGEITLTTEERIGGLVQAERFERGFTTISIQLEDGRLQQYPAESVKQIRLQREDGEEERFVRAVANVNTLPRQGHYEKRPDIQPATLPLMVLLASDALSLYTNEQTAGPRYFIQKGESVISELILHRYQDGPGSAYVELPEYRRQLTELMADCGSLSFAGINQLRYNRRQLLQIVEQYNACREAPPSFVYREPRSRLQPGLSIGGNLANLQFSGTSAINRITDADFDWTAGYQAGLVLDYGLGKYTDKYTLSSEFWFRQYHVDGAQEELLPGNLLERRAITVDLAYLNWNLLFKYQPNRNWLLLGGVTQGVIVRDNSTVSLEKVFNNETSYSEEAFLKNGPADGLKRYNQGVMAGVGYRLNRLEASLRFEWNNGIESLGNTRSNSQGVLLVANYFLVSSMM